MYQQKFMFYGSIDAGSNEIYFLHPHLSIVKNTVITVTAVTVSIQ